MSDTPESVGAYTYTQIGGVNYRCKKLPALKALQLATETARYLGAALATLFAGATDKQANWWSVALFVLQDGLVSLTPEAAQGLMLRMMESVHVEGDKNNLGNEKAFNAHFDKVGLFTALEVWRWALEVNFKSFFDDLRSRASRNGEDQTGLQGQTD